MILAPANTFLIQPTPIVWYNSGVKLILPLLLIVCAPFAEMAAETFVLAPSLEPDAEAVTNCFDVENTRFDIMIR